MAGRVWHSKWLGLAALMAAALVILWGGAGWAQILQLPDPVLACFQACDRLTIQVVEPPPGGGPGSWAPIPHQSVTLTGEEKAALLRTLAWDVMTFIRVVPNIDVYRVRYVLQATTPHGDACALAYSPWTDELSPYQRWDSEIQFHYHTLYSLGTQHLEAYQGWFPEHRLEVSPDLTEALNRYLVEYHVPPPPRPTAPD